jgi:prevent-host-death family protein
MEAEGEGVRSDRARRKFRALLNRVEHDGEHVTILRYDTPAAVLVPVEWHDKALAVLAGEESAR